MTTVFSIGHSAHPWDRFADLLTGSKITALVDVRSSPVSRCAHFNRSALIPGLEAIGIEYVFLGAALGGRPKSGGRVDYERMAQAQTFLAGIDRLEEIAQQNHVAIMCAEHDPLQCHRSVLVARRLVERGVDVQHILRDGEIEPHAVTEDRLLKLTRQTESDLFTSRADRLAHAYRIQNQRLWRTRP